MSRKSQLSPRHTSQARESSTRQVLPVLCGEDQAWDCAKSNSHDFLELVRQLVPVLEPLSGAGRGPVPGKAGKRTHPRTVWGSGAPQTPSTSIILQPWAQASCPP